MIIFKIFIYIFSSTFLFSYLNAKTLIIENNSRLTFDDIDNLTKFDLKSPYLNEDDLNLIIKDLVSSDLISSLETSIDSNNFYISVKESFFINKIFINGNIKLKNKDIIDNIPIKNNSFADNNKINSNLQIIENLYSSIGQQNVIVSYYLEVVNENSFNLIYEINENIENYISEIIINGNSFVSNKFLKSALSIKE
ncbi:hypothetical protein N9751_02320, partial [Alphaproteobacteria bacterium]|nr:hypothetical protein [Alphaproteobacteria bacterium]